MTVVAWLYWTRYVPTLSSKITEEPEKTGSSLQRLLGYMKPYVIRFGGVLFLVVVSSLGNNHLLSLVKTVNFVRGNQI